MSRVLAQILSEVLAKGVQLHPEAYALLQELGEGVDLPTLVLEAVRGVVASGRFVIMKEDLVKLLPEDSLERGAEEPRDEAVVEEGAGIKDGGVEIIRESPNSPLLLEGVEGFKELFRSRYSKLLKLAMQRPDSHQIRKIGHLSGGEEGTAKVAGLVMEKRLGRGYVTLAIDDDTGRLNVRIADEQVRVAASEVCLDQLVIVDVEFGRGGAVAKGVYHPDIPERIPKRAERGAFAVLTSDLHVGSKRFSRGAFERFLRWLRSDDEIARKVKYVVIAGDVVDGVGVYPGQEMDLESPDLRVQFQEAALFIGGIPKDIKIFVIPGNHDPVRQALPQPPIPLEYAEPLYGMENVRFFGNPLMISLHGVNILVYHGRSLDDIVASTPGLSFSRPALAMRLALRARHLAPTYGARTELAPDDEDRLVIEDVPDVFHAGHIHILDSTTYRGTLIVNSGTWQERTAYQTNMGIDSTPGVVPILNLSTLEVHTKDFVGGEVG